MANSNSTHPTSVSQPDQPHVVSRIVLITADITSQFTVYFADQKYAEVRDAENNSRLACWTDASIRAAINDLYEAAYPPIEAVEEAQVAAESLPASEHIIPVGTWPDLGPCQGWLLAHWQQPESDWHSPARHIAGTRSKLCDHCHREYTAAMQAMSRQQQIAAHEPVCEPIKGVA